MGLISPTQVSDGTTADASDVNTPINQIANEFNGNIDNANIKTAAAIDGSKIASNSLDVGSKASIWDGWVAVQDTWTYASATTVTVPSDATTKYSVGDKIKFSNGSTKYFTIQAVTATLITFTGGSATVANSAITSIYYSKVLTPQSFPGIANPYKFSAYRSAALNSSSSATKIAFDTENFDTNNNFATGTYTVPIAGYYQFNAMAGNTAAASTLILTVLYKNGSEALRGNGIDSTLNGGLSSSHVSGLISCAANDTVEVYFIGGGGSIMAVGASNCYFNGFLVSQT